MTAYTTWVVQKFTDRMGWFDVDHSESLATAERMYVDHMEAAEDREGKDASRNFRLVRVETRVVREHPNADLP